LPENYDEIVQSLLNYDRLLEKLIGGYCKHWKYASGIMDTFVDKKAKFKDANREDGVNLLYVLHNDAKTCLENVQSSGREWRSHSQV